MGIVSISGAGRMGEGVTHGLWGWFGWRVRRGGVTSLDATNSAWHVPLGLGHCLKNYRNYWRGFGETEGMDENKPRIKKTQQPTSTPITQPGQSSPKNHEYSWNVLRRF